MSSSPSDMQIEAPTRPNSPTNDDTESDEEMKVKTKKRKRNEATTPRKKQKTKTEKRQYGICCGLPWPKEWIEEDKADPCVYHITLRGKIEYLPYSHLPESTPVIFPSSVEVNSAEANVKLVKEMRKKVRLGYTARTFAYSSGYWVRFGPQDKERLDLINSMSGVKEKENEKKEVKVDPFSAFRKDLLALPVKDGPNLALMEQRMLQIQREGMTPQQIKEDEIEWENEKRQAMETALFDLMKFATAIWWVKEKVNP